MDTIAALATAPFRSAIGVIRMSGDDAFAIAKAVLRIPGGVLMGETQTKNVTFARIVDGDEVIDQAVVCAFKAPHSYTGEDTVEFSCHGGVYLLDRVLRLLFAHGARQAEGGEFTKRAFLNGKTDLTRAEGVMDLIDAEYAASSRAAMSELDGSVGKAILGIQEQILAVTSKLLAYVDYPDDEIGEVSVSEIKSMLTQCLSETETLCNSYSTGKILKEGIKTALCGRPNVGKSSVMNRISGSDRSIVTSIAGTTRDTVEETVVFGGVKLILTDTAGIRQTADEVEQIGVQRAKKEMEKAELICCIFGEDLTEEDKNIAEEALQYQGKTVFLFNKSDLGDSPLPPWAEGVECYRVSAKTGEGFDCFAEGIKGFFSASLPVGQVVISNGRQYQCLCRIRTALLRAKQNLAFTPDVIVSDLEEALASVGEITGQTVSDRTVQEIFSRFCVGK